MIEITYRCPADHPCPLVHNCPVGAIKQQGNGRPDIDQDKCIKCGICLSACPLKAVKINEAVYG